VAAADEIEAEGAAQCEPVAGTPVRARRADEALDVLVHLDLVDVAGRRGAPAEEGVAGRVQVVLEARAAVDVRGDTEHAGIVALRQSEMLLDVAAAEREIRARRQGQVEIRARRLTIEMTRAALQRTELE